MQGTNTSKPSFFHMVFINWKFFNINTNFYFQEFNVLDTQPAEAQPLKQEMENLVMMWLVGTTVFLGMLLILVVSICLSQRARYQRQLKAATVTAFGECFYI